MLCGAAHPWQRHFWTPNHLLLSLHLRPKSCWDEPIWECFEGKFLLYFPLSTSLHIWKWFGDCFIFRISKYPYFLANIIDSLSSLLLGGLWMSVPWNTCKASSLCRALPRFGAFMTTRINLCSVSKQGASVVVGISQITEVHFTNMISIVLFIPLQWTEGKQVKFGMNHFRDITALSHCCWRDYYQLGSSCAHLSFCTIEMMLSRQTKGKWCCNK